MNCKLFTLISIIAFATSCSSMKHNSKENLRKVASEDNLTSDESAMLKKVSFQQDITLNIDSRLGKKINKYCYVKTPIYNLYRRDDNGNFSEESALIKNYWEATYNLEEGAHLHPMYSGKVIHLKAGDQFEGVKFNGSSVQITPKKMYYVKSDDIYFDRYDVEGISYKANASFYYNAKDLIKNLNIITVKTDYDPYIKIDIACSTEVLKRGVFDGNEDAFMKKQFGLKNDFIKTIKTLKDVVNFDEEAPFEHEEFVKIN